ncbi:RNA-binding component of cleavage and polyadenylation factor [Claviceps capensis]|nr:RNA-binding component of cleavage and polyadenylation factor [Claviceps capensis]
MATSTIAAAASSILNHTPQTYTFRFSPFLRQTHQVGLPPDRPICKAYQTGSCPNGTRCLERHVQDASKTSQPTGGLNSLVCKHWLRGLCKKGEHCEFLHEYNLRKMPECNFFMRNGYCSNGEECLYLHVDPSSKLPPCPHYDMGFCPLGPHCSKKHVRRKLCEFYLAGFCPEGPECKSAHPKWSLTLEGPTLKSEEKKEEKKPGEAMGHGHGHGDGFGGSGRFDEDGGGDGTRERNRDRERGGERDRDREDGRFGRHRGGGKWRGGRGGRFRGRGGH